jgi:hypothetical protein
MSSLPVVNYGRMERLRPLESTYVPLNLNTFCIVLIILCILGLYKRHTDLNRRRERYHT